MVLRDLPYKYNPSPSKYLLDRGTIVEGSYVVGKGTVHLDNGNNIDCEFEVAHMQTGISWAVVYVEFPHFKAKTHSQTKRRWLLSKRRQLRKLKSRLPNKQYKTVSKWRKGHKPNLAQVYTHSHSARLHRELSELSNNLKRSSKISGKDLLRGESVNLKLYRWVKGNGGTMSTGVRLVFMVADYTVANDYNPETHTYYNFELVNLPISRDYSPEVTSARASDKFQDELDEAKLLAAIERAIEAGQNGEDAETITQLAKEAAQEKQEELEKNSDPIYIDYIPIIVEGETVARLYWLREFEDKEYKYQPCARLFINSAKLPEDWSAEITSQWICSLISLALGRQVIWNYYFLSETSREYLPPLRHWRSLNFQENTFLAFTEENNQFYTSRGLDEESQTINLVQDVLSNLFVEPPVANEEYLNVLSSYVFYASTSFDEQQKCTLLCATVEYLYHVWERLENPMNPPKFFKKRLKWILSLEGWFTDTSVATSGTMGHRAEEFVDSRNKLFHEHRFFHDNLKKYPDARDRSERVYKEITNIESFVPILIVTILLYEGRFWDNIWREWRWMPK